MCTSAGGAAGMLGRAAAAGDAVAVAGIAAAGNGTVVEGNEVDMNTDCDSHLD